MDNKTDIRIKAKNLRKTLPILSISQTLTQALKKDDYYVCAKNVMFFYPMDNEIDLRGILSDDKRFYLPRVNGNNIEVCPYSLGDKLKKSAFGVLEPVLPATDPKEPDLVIVPALMADSQGYRLGYGGGYYDRFLSKYGKNFKTISLLPRVLMVEKLPIDEYDVKIDKIIFK